MKHFREGIMRVTLLKDLDENCVDAVITSYESRPEEIQEAIARAKEKPDYQWDDIIKELPKDCKIYDKWSGTLESIYY